jgi:hypothetical protein
LALHFIRYCTHHIKGGMQVLGDSGMSLVKRGTMGTFE